MNVINFEEVNPQIEIEYSPKDVSLYEHLTCAGDLRKETISSILNHYENIASAIDKAENDGVFSEDDDFTANLKIGGDVYWTCDAGELVKLLSENITNSEDFILYTQYFGPNLPLGADSDIYGGLRDIITNAEPNENIEYKRCSMYDFQDEEMCFYQNGVPQDLKCNAQIIDGENERLKSWYNRGITLEVYFDFSKNPDLLKELHSCVLNHTNLSNYRDCKECWEEGCMGMLLCDFQWSSDCLREPQQFLNEINSVLEPVKDEVGIESEGCWYYMYSDGFAAAWIEKRDGALKLVKAEL